MTDREAARPPSTSLAPAPPLMPAPPPAPPLPVAPLSAPPLAGRVEITFEYTYEELREGLTQTADFQQQQQKRQSGRGLLGWVFFVATAVLIFMLLDSRNKTRAPIPAATPTPPPSSVDLVIAVGPSALIATVVGTFAILIALAIYLMTAKKEKNREAGKQMPTVAMFAAILIAILGAGALMWEADEGRWLVTPGRAMMLSLAPWVVVLIICVALAVWLTRTQLRRQWETKPYLRRRRTIILDAAGEHCADGVTDLLYRWPYFRSAWETPNCLVLLDENDARHILPKRVMDQPMLDAARSVISNHVADCKFLTTPGGFPVASPPAPSADPARSLPVQGR